MGQVCHKGKGPGFCEARPIVNTPVSPKTNDITPVSAVEASGEDEDGAVHEGDELTEEVVAEVYDDEDEVLCGLCDPEGEDDNEEVAPHKKLRNPHAPSPQDILDHRILHWPYRSWCRACVYGRGRHAHHQRAVGPKAESGVPQISIDFIFLGCKKVEARKNAILVMFDNDSGAVWAYRTGRKRAPNWLVPAILQDLDEAGYSKSRICIRSDQERVIKSIKGKIISERMADTVPMESPVKESQCNGRMEKAVQTLEGQIRTLVMDLKLEAGIELSPRAVAYPYLVRWACTVISRYKLTPCGKTPFHILTGRQCTRPITSFASPVVWKKSMKESERLKGETDWDSGIFLGVRWRTSEAIIATEEKIVLCRTVQNDPEMKVPTEDMLRSIPETLMEFNYSQKEDPEALEPEASDNEVDQKKDDLDEDDVANLFGDFTDDEPNAEEKDAHPQNEPETTPADGTPRASESAQGATTPRSRESDVSYQSDVADGVMNSVTVDRTQEGVRKDMWDAAQRSNKERTAELNQVVGKILRGVDVTEIYSPARIAAADRKSVV